MTTYRGDDWRKYPTVCHACGKNFTLPFEPSPLKKYFCEECFKRVREERENRVMYKATCSQCQEECEVPFQPTEGRPVYCSECYEKERHKNQ